MMSDKQFEARLTHIEEQAAAMQERVDGFRDQELSKAFVESAWSQDKLAEVLSKRWGKELGHAWVSYRLRFGRFLQFFSTNCGKDWTIPRNLTEGRFRSYWERTEAKVSNRGHLSQSTAAVEDEQRRFEEVLSLMRGDTVLVRNRKKTSKAIINSACGKGWKTLDELRELASESTGDDFTTIEIEKAIGRIKPTQKLPFYIERATTPTGPKYRIVKTKAPVISEKKLVELRREFLPMLRDLLKEIKKHPVERSHAEMASLAIRLEQVLESVEQEVSVES